MDEPDPNNRAKPDVGNPHPFWLGAECSTWAAVAVDTVVINSPREPALIRYIRAVLPELSVVLIKFVALPRTPYG